MSTPTFRWVLIDSVVFWTVKVCIVDVLYPLLKEVL
jgi:hypothetical protein